MMPGDLLALLLAGMAALTLVTLWALVPMMRGRR